MEAHYRITTAEEKDVVYEEVNSNLKKMGDQRIKGLEIMHPAHTARKTEITYSKVENEFPTKGKTKETTKEPT
jgi:hypothetical protein